MRQCPHCRAPYPLNTVFCESCGAPLRALGEEERGSPSPAKPGSGPLQAIILEIATSGRAIELRLESDGLVLGRVPPSNAPEPALDLTEDGGVEAGVSRRHARLSLKGDQVLLEDLDSTNGTWINEARLRPHQAFPLRHGDAVRLGRLAMNVRLITQRGPAAALNYRRNER